MVQPRTKSLSKNLHYQTIIVHQVQKLPLHHKAIQRKKKKVRERESEDLKFGHFLSVFLPLNALQGTIDFLFIIHT